MVHGVSSAWVVPEPRLLTVPSERPSECPLLMIYFCNHAHHRVFTRSAAFLKATYPAPLVVRKQLGENQDVPISAPVWPGRLGQGLFGRSTWARALFRVDVGRQAGPGSCQSHQPPRRWWVFCVCLEQIEGHGLRVQLKGEARGFTRE